ncbi:PD40 domain-containing protein [Candidatus Woesearchaeota archaeon]|nr:PD40 domain-containing protein [Candidatus Woesearchaeota archaeon]
MNTLRGIRTAAYAALLSLLPANCGELSSCKTDNDCKESRVCEYNRDLEGLFCMTPEEAARESETEDARHQEEPNGNDTEEDIGRDLVFTHRFPIDGFEPNIYRMNQNGSGILQLTFAEAHGTHRNPRWSPDGRYIYFTGMDFPPPHDYEGRRIFRMNADGSNMNVVTDREGESPDISPDGEMVIFKAFRDPQWDLYIMNADGSGELNISQGYFGDMYQPRWSPDGRFILVGGTHRESEDQPVWTAIYLLSPDGSYIEKVAPRGEFPAWSPDGTKFAYVKTTVLFDEDTGQEIKENNIYVRDITAGFDEQITFRNFNHNGRDGPDERGLSWENDGLIYFAADGAIEGAEDKDLDIFTVDPISKEIEHIIFEGVDETPDLR